LRVAIQRLSHLPMRWKNPLLLSPAPRADALLEAHASCATHWLPAFRTADDERHAPANRLRDRFVAQHVARLEHAHAEELLGDLRDAAVHDLRLVRVRTWLTSRLTRRSPPSRDRTFTTAYASVIAVGSGVVTMST
jgi:hypothetical protein